jgi:pimeloyl-ACP methyl ester carboxylesterase
VIGMPYRRVDDIDMYHEVHGRSSTGGRPLVLLHGALSTITTSFGQMLARDRRVIAVEMRGHGHTAGGNRAMTLARHALDLAGLMDALGLSSVDVFGYSVGAAVAVELAVTRPDLVARLVLASVCFDRQGFEPGVLDGIDDLDPAVLDGSPWHQAYLAVAPDRSGWEALVAATLQADRDFAGWPAPVVESLVCPTLIVNGDRDIVRPEHAVEMLRRLPDARLAILPGTQHEQIPERAEVVAPMVVEFLSGAGA